MVPSQMELCKRKSESRACWIFIFNVGHIEQFFLESRACKKISHVVAWRSRQD